MPHSPLYDFPVNTLAGEPTTLATCRGKVLLIVNVASKCSFTPQYEGLETLYRKYRDQGFIVLGFPCNQFFWQEPGGPDAIQACPSRYSVTFPIFEKINVNGVNAHPLYKWLKGQKRGLLGTGFIKWNFGKFLINRQGEVVKRYSMFTKPAAIAKDIESLLAVVPAGPVKS
ncbi:glutathione peroxidase [soil metagenome]